jgi:membrane protein CcdC involved in cytochrome C biogenesis
MPASPDPKPPQPQLVTKRRLVLPVIAILSGVALFVIREFCRQGRVSILTLEAALAALVIGLLILAVLVRHANQPEK